jgi:hypothetical protein
MKRQITRVRRGSTLILQPHEAEHRHLTPDTARWQRAGLPAFSVSSFIAR